MSDSERREMREALADQTLDSSARARLVRALARYILQEIKEERRVQGLREVGR